MNSSDVGCAQGCHRTSSNVKWAEFNNNALGVAIGVPAWMPAQAGSPHDPVSPPGPGLYATQRGSS